MRPDNWVPVEQIEPTIDGLLDYFKTQNPASQPTTQEGGFISDYLQSAYHLDSVDLWFRDEEMLANVSRVWKDDAGYHEEEANIHLPESLKIYYDEEWKVAEYPSVTQAIQITMQIREGGYD